MFREEAPLTDVIYRKDLPLSKTSNGNLKFSVKVSKYLKLKKRDQVKFVDNVQIVSSHKIFFNAFVY